MKGLMFAAVLLVTTIVWFAQCHSFHYKVHSYENRRKCKYWQQSGCFLDVLEKICSPQGPIQDVIASELDPKMSEDLFLCCCPMPYQRCPSHKMDQDCLLHLQKRFPSNPIRKFSQTDVVNGVQHVRAVLLSKDENCTKYLAPISPISSCQTKKPAPFRRVDLICELLLWQWEELGDGDKKEFGYINCPYIVSHKAKNGNARKGEDDEFTDLVCEKLLKQWRKLGDGNKKSIWHNSCPSIISRRAENEGVRMSDDDDVVDLICETLLKQLEKFGDGNINCPNVISHIAENGGGRKRQRSHKALTHYRDHIKRRIMLKKLRDYQHELFK